MLCPSCHVEYPPETHECPKCGVVLAKWHSGKPLTTPRLEGEERSSPIILYGGLVLAVLGAIYYWRAPGGAPAETVHMQAPPPPAPAAPEGTEASAPLAPEAPAQDNWRFEGTVFNLRNGAPVASVQVDLKSGGKVHRTATDTAGRFRLDVPSMEEGGYGAVLAHPQYRPGNIKGSPEGLAEEFRGRMDCAQQGEAEVLRGKAGEVTAADFMLCPRKN